MQSPDNAKAAVRLDAELRKLLALAKEFERKNRTRSKGVKSETRAKMATVSEAELLTVGGVKDDSRIVFGGKTRGDVKLTFTPMKTGLWNVGFAAELSSHELRRELSKAGRKLWNTPERKPDIAYQAVESLLACWQNFRGLPENEHQKAQVHFAISTTLQALERDSKSRDRKLQLAFGLLTNSRRLSGASESIDSLRQRVWMAAVNFQRPPFKAEVYEFYRNPPNYRQKYRLDKSDFAKLLRSAGLSWLPRKKRSRAR